MSHLYRRNSIYWIAYYQNNKLYRQSLKTKDRSTAIYLQSKKNQEISEGKLILPDANKDVGIALEEYRRAFEHHKTKDTHNDDINRIKNFFRWADIRRFEQITEKKLQDFLTYRINNEKITLTTANRVITNLKTFLNFAVRRRYIIENPVRFFKRYRIPENPGRFLTNDEIDRLLAAAKDPENYIDGKPTFYPILATAIYSGMREQEIFSLEWQNIDFNRNIIIILNKPGFTTKTKKFRVIPLNNKLKTILLPLRKASGRCFDTTNQRRIFDRIIRNAKLEGIGWREIRRTLGSHLAMEGVSLLKIAKWYGHSNPQITYKHYAHLAPETSDNDINRF